MRKYLFAAIFVLPLLGAGLGWLAGPFVARAHRDVQLARDVHREQVSGVRGSVLETEAFWETGEEPETAFAHAELAERKLTLAAVALGSWFGLVLSVKMFALSGRPNRNEYGIDHARCVACTRCYISCPRERQRRKEQV